MDFSNNYIRKSSNKNRLSDFSRTNSNRGLAQKTSNKKNRFSSNNKKEKTESRGKKILKRIGIISMLTLLFGFLLGTLFLLGLVSAYSKDLPNVDEYFSKISDNGMDTIITDRNGKELYRLRGDTVKERVYLKDVPEKLQWAFLAAEDSSFWTNRGLNMVGLSRALFCTVKNRGQAACGGGSSITQQLIKNTTPLKQRTLERKIKEAVLAMKVEQKYSKEEVLEFYLNVVPEGGDLVGVKTGSIYLFDKEDLNKLTLAEMAYLAAIPNEPSVLSPKGGIYYDPDKSRGRAEYVLNRMLELKSSTGVTEEEIQKAKEELPKVVFKNKQIDKTAPHYVDYVLDQLDKIYKDKTDDKDRSGRDYFREKGYVIKAAVDLDTQQLLERKIKEGVEDPKYQEEKQAENAAAVIMNPKNGEILAIVGSRDYYSDSGTKKFNPQFNAATAKRSMGSSVKPFTYMNAFMHGYHPSSIVPDVPIDLSGGGTPYYPQNYSRSYSNTFMTMRDALRISLNVPAVSSLILGGIENYQDTYRKLTGWDGFVAEGPAATLGAANLPLLEQVHAYATLATEGMFHEKVSILEIKDHSGNVVYKPEYKGKQVIERKYAYLANDMNSNYYLINNASLAPTAVDLKNTMFFGGKTGTGDNSEGIISDIVFVGYTPTFVLGIWSGNSCGGEECPLGPGADSNDVYRLLYEPFLNEYRDKIVPEKYESVPEGLHRVNICSKTGRLWTEECEKVGGSSIGEWVPDTSLPQTENMIEKVSITKCGSEEKLARQIDKDLGLAEDKYYIVYKYDNAWMQAQVTAYQEKNNLLPPKEECNLERKASKISIVIVSPDLRTQYKPGDDVNVNVQVIPGSAGGDPIPINRVEVYLDNVIQKTFTSAPYEFTLSLPKNIRSGRHILTIVATDKRGGTDGQAKETREIAIVNGNNSTPTPTPTPTNTPILTPTPTPTLLPTMTVTVTP